MQQLGLNLFVVLLCCIVCFMLLCQQTVKNNMHYAYHLL